MKEEKVPTEVVEEEIVKVEDVPEEVAAVIEKPAKPEALDSWQPKTELGRRVKAKEIVNIDEVISSGKKVLEAEIIDALLPNLEMELIMIGQAKGKFGGGQRRIFKQTQKKTAEGNSPSFTTMAVIGNKNGYVGLGMAGSKETVPARNKAVREAKLNLLKVMRGCGSWECGCGKPHSIPFKVTGRCGAIRVTLMPAPMGTGLCVEKECQKLLKLAGIKDVWSQTYGKTATKSNLIKACFRALAKLMTFKISDTVRGNLNIVEGALIEEPAKEENGKKQ